VTRGKRQPSKTKRTRKGENDSTDTTKDLLNSKTSFEEEQKPTIKSSRESSGVGEVSIHTDPVPQERNADSIVIDETEDLDQAQGQCSSMGMTVAPLDRQESPAPTKLKASASPQSSDAENHPPSSSSGSAQQRPVTTSPTKNQMPSMQVPLSTATPTASPSKRNMINGKLESTLPWQTVDLETIFLGSPDKENRTLTETLRMVGADLTSPEKKMSVEEWVRENATQGEQRLRRDCERLVGVFETQGLNALRSLEAIRCL
jgi:hypothetical protein